MIFGKIKKDEKIIKFNVKMQCVNCNKQVPGGMKSSENYFNTHEFNKELEKFQKIYLCGICRDKKRTKN
jgi:hypothetical protein